MRIHTRVEIDIKTGEVLRDEWYEYDGPLTLAGSSEPQAVPMPPTKTTSRTVTSPWKVQAPYLQRGFRAALQNLRKPNRYFPGRGYVPASAATRQGMNALSNAANAARGIMNPVYRNARALALGRGQGDAVLRNIAQGKISGADTFQKAYGDEIIERMNAEFAGDFGSGYHQKITADELSQTAAQMAQADIDRRLEAAGMMGANQRANLGLATQLAGQAPHADHLFRRGAVGEQYQQAALNDRMARWQHNQMERENALANYMQMVGGNYGSTSSSSGTSTNPPMYQQSPWMGALGGAATGAGIGAMFKSPWAVGLGAIGGGLLGGGFF